MKVSLNWLRELVPFSQNAAELSELLTRAGVEVEKIEVRGADFPKVVVAQILESTPHPNADRLSVCRVDDGSGEPRQIVCGAKNYAVGDKVPLALPGAVLPGDFKIKVGKLRGVDSEGMLCSASELRLAAESSGLLILPAEAVVGTPIGSLFPPDTVLDLEITPNRSDLLSHRGLAREIAALTGGEMVGEPEFVRVTNAADFIRVENPELCPHYTARRIENVKVGASPDWLRQKLETLGLRSINNVVDVTNFVMLEMGQPLHAFDAAAVEGGIVVRTARPGETLLALDGKTYALTGENLLIADEKKPLGLAGVMGGERSGVTAATTTIVLESAYFFPGNIRRTGRTLGIQSDAAYRFERGVDPGNIEAASARAVALIEELTGGTAMPILSSAGGFSEERRTVALRPERVEKVLGLAVALERIREILRGFGLEENGADWRVPSFRPDLTREIDLIEEIIRVVGIETVPSREQARFTAASEADRFYDHTASLRRRVMALGFQEIRTLSLIGATGTDEVLRLRNPMNEEESILRPSLLPGLQAVAGRNARLGAKNLRLFELGRVFHPTGEATHLALLWTGMARPESWRREASRAADFFDLKGILEALQLEGTITQLPQALAKKLDLPGPVFVAEIELPPLSSATIAPVARELPKFPAISRDIALLVAESRTHREITEAIASAQEPLLVEVRLFDLFTDPAGEKVPLGQKSLAYSLTYRASDRTLTLSEGNEAHSRIKARLAALLGAQFRE